MSQGFALFFLSHKLVERLSSSFLNVERQENRDVAFKIGFVDRSGCRYGVCPWGNRLCNCPDVGSGFATGNAHVHERRGRGRGVGNNQGVFVDRTTFKLHLGKPKGDPISEIKRTGAKEVSQGAIIFRSDGKLYIVDAKPTE